MSPNDMKKDDDFEIGFYEDLLKKNENFLQALMALGDLYTKKGRYEEGLIIDKKLAQLRPEDPIILYNLACSYSLLKRMDEALRVVQMAIKSGYDNFDFLLKDPDLENLRQDKRFQNYLAQMKKNER